MIATKYDFGPEAQRRLETLLRRAVMAARVQGWDGDDEDYDFTREDLEIGRAHV